MDDDRSRSLDFQEFKKGVRNYGMTMDVKEVQDMFHAFDRDGSGTIDFDEFLVKLRPPLSKARQSLIRKAFLKLDKTGWWDSELDYCRQLLARNMTHKSYFLSHFERCEAFF